MDNKDIKLGDNFKLSEFTKSQVAVRKDIDNTPNAEVIHNLTSLVAHVLQPVSNRFKKDVIISSGYRSFTLNVAIGGSPTSDHCKGYAADFEVIGVDNKEVAKYIQDNLNFKQLILEFYEEGKPNSGWIHVSFDSCDLKRQVLKAERINGRTVYTTVVL